MKALSGIGNGRKGWTPWWAVLAFLLAVPASAGDLRVILEAEGGVRSDGNYNQMDLPEEPGIEDEEETLARAGFHLRLSYGLPRLQLSMGYSPFYEWVLGNTETNGTTHRLDLSLLGNLTRRLEMRVRERLLSSSTLDLYAPFTEPDAVAVARRGDQLTHSLDVALDQDLTRRMSLLLGATHTLRTFETEELSDTETLAARVGAGWDLYEDRRLDALATIGYFDFGSRRRGLANELDREADVQTLGVGYQQPVWRDGRLRVEAGLFSVDTIRLIETPGLPGQPPVRTEEEDSDTGWRGALEISRDLELLDWSLGYRHDVSAGVGLGRATEADSAFAGVSTLIGRRLVLGVDGNISRHEDLSDDRPALGEEDVAQDSVLEAAAATARFSWSFSTVARLTGGYSHVWQESRVEPFEDLSYSRYFLGLALQLYRSGEEPEDPARQGETDDDDEPDAP